MADDDRLLTVAEVAAMLRRSTDFVRRAARDGRIPAIPMPGRGRGEKTTWRFRRSEVEAWIAHRFDGEGSGP